jgi:hypothetical protein
VPTNQDAPTATRRSFASTITAVFGPGALAGIVGGVTIDAYILATAALTHGPGPQQLYTFIASALVGRAAYTLPGMVWLGVVAHAAISIGWGVGFAYAAATSPQILARPYVSGFFFGVVVYTIMQLLTVTTGVARMPTTSQALAGIVAHTIFFGIPVALIATRRLRAA